LAGVGTGSFFFGMMRGGPEDAGASGSMDRGRCRKYAVPPSNTTAITAKRTPRFIAEMLTDSDGK
jgi:hypothetical protein